MNDSLAQTFLIYCGVNFGAVNGVTDFQSKPQSSFETCLRDCVEYNVALPAGQNPWENMCTGISLSHDVCYMKHNVSFESFSYDEDESVDSAILMLLGDGHPLATLDPS